MVVEIDIGSCPSLVLLNVLFSFSNLPCVFVKQIVHVNIVW